MPSPSRSLSSPQLSFASIFKVLAVVIGVWTLWQIRDIVLYCFIALLLAGVIYPLANWAARYRIPRVVSVLCVYFGLFGLLALIITLLIPALISQSSALVEVYGQHLGNATQFLQSASFMQHIQQNGFDLGASGLQNQVQALASNALSVATDVFGGIAGFIVVLVLALYLVIEDSAIKNIFHQWVPKMYQEFFTRVTWLIMEKLGAWIRGQMLLCFIIGLLYLVAFWVVGVPYALLLAVLGGIFEFVPYVGPILAAIPAVILAFTASPAIGIATIVALIIIQQLENNLIVPKVMQRSIGMNPIVSILAFLIGAKLFGIVGAIAAIPVALAITVGLTEWQAFHGRLRA